MKNPKLKLREQIDAEWEAEDRAIQNAIRRNDLAAILN